MQDFAVRRHVSKLKYHSVIVESRKKAGEISLKTSPRLLLAIIRLEFKVNYDS